MTAIEGRPHRKEQIVTCTIERILPFGVFVRLEDGTEGYIRRRELSLSGDQEAMSEFKLGDSVTAVIVEPESPGRTLELSRRAALPDPWLDFTRNFRVGSTVEGTVKRLTNSGADIEILPGVNGFAPLAELAPWPISAPNDVVWPGDRVKGAVVYINFAEHRVRLSLKRVLEQAAFIQSVLDRVPGTIENADEEVLPSVTQTDFTLEQDNEPAKLDAPILVVEDMVDIRKALIKWLDHQGYEALEAQSSRNALKICQERPFALVIADLDMPDLDGASLVRELRVRNINVPIAIMSNPDLLELQLPRLRAYDIATAFPKPLDLRDIHELLVRLANGERPTMETRWGMLEIPAEIRPYQELTRVARTHSPISARLRYSLEQLIRVTDASASIIFHLNPVSMQVTILEKAGEIRLQMDALYGLLESPVRDVIVGEQPILENHVSRERSAQFRKLQDLLPFESCIAVPLHVAGHTEHALFLFQRAEGAFSTFRLRDAAAAATLLTTALENQALDERVRALSGLFLSGQLAAGFGHEVFNKLASLDLQFKNLRSDVVRLTREQIDMTGSSNLPALTALQNAVEHAVGTVTELGRTVTEFRRLMGTREDRAIDVNQVARQAVLLIQPVARRAQVSIRLSLAEDLPTVAGSSLGLQQAFLNIMLNAVQHTERKPHNYRLLTVSTSCCGSESDQRVQARLSDTGPGIHFQLWDKVFALGFTTRQGGSGLGLYIAESLLNNMGGRVSIESSLVPFGTTFLVELPVKSIKESEQ